MIKKISLFLIKLYQIFLSPDQGVFRFKNSPTCRFYPTCSRYAIEAVEKYGLFRGFGLGVKRILRCHPWNEGGYDPIK